MLSYERKPLGPIPVATFTDERVSRLLLGLHVQVKTCRYRVRHSVRKTLLQYDEVRMIGGHCRS